MNRYIMIKKKGDRRQMRSSGKEDRKKWRGPVTGRKSFFSPPGKSTGLPFLMNRCRHLSGWIICMLIFILSGSSAQELPSSAGYSAGPEDTLYLTLEDVIDISLSGSPEIELADIRYAIANLQYNRFATFLKPSLNLNADAPILNRAINVINQPDGREEFVNQSTMRNRVGASLDYQMASTGGRVYVATSIERLDVFRTEAFPYSKSYFFTPISIGLEQPLFQFNAIKWQKEILQRQEEQTDAGRILEQEKVIYDVVSAFNELELIRRNMELMRNKIEDARSLIGIKEKLFMRGSGSLAEMKQLALDTLRTSIDYQAVRLDYENKNRELMDLCGLDRKHLLIPVSTAEIYLPSVDLNTAIDQAIHNRARSSGIRLRMAEANRDIEQAEKDRGVALDISASLGINNTAETFSGLQYHFLDRELLSIGLRMPITDWGRRRINRQLANIQLDHLQKTLDEEERSITRQVIDLYRHYDFLREKMEVNTIALHTAEEIYESVRDQYLRGSIDWVSLQQNRSNLDNAILVFHQTRADAVRTYYQIRSLVLYDFERNEPLIYHEK